MMGFNIQINLLGRWHLDDTYNYMIIIIIIINFIEYKLMNKKVFLKLFF